MSSNISIVLEDIMSNQENGFQGSQPFITDNDYKSLSLDQLRYILNQKKQGLEDSYKKLSEKEKIIRDIRKLDKLNKEVKQGIDIKKKLKKKAHVKKTKTFEEYFEECIKNKKIPKDTPSYLREALERAMKEYDQGLEKEKSALEGFANKYTIQGIPGLLPMDFFEEINQTLRDFLTYHRNIKFRMVLVCIMEKQNIQQNVGVVGLEEGKAYFNTPTITNTKSNDVGKLIKVSKDFIDGHIESYTEKGSGWYFKKVDKLEIHTVEYNPTKGSSYISLPGWISNKKAIVNIKTKMINAFFGAYCVIFIQKKEMKKE